MIPESALHMRLKQAGLNPQEARDFASWVSGVLPVASLKALPEDLVRETAARIATWNPERLAGEIADWRLRQTPEWNEAEAARLWEALPSVTDLEPIPLFEAPEVEPSYRAWQSGLRGARRG